jgi:prophage tail gpP-like protein
MGQEIISVVVDGERFTAWKRFELSASMKEAARSFSLEVAAEAGALATAWKFKAGTSVEIYANDDLLCRGFVDRYQPKIGPTSADVSITGRSKSADLIDSSAIHDTGHFKDMTPDQIANELAADHGVEIVVDEELEPISHQLTPGKSVFREIEVLAREQGYTLMGEADGNIRITKAGSKRHAGGIIEGHNLKDGSADHDWSNRHAKYVVKGQLPDGHGPDSLELEAIARDAGVDRSNRVIIIVQEENTDKNRIKKRAKNRRDRSAGNGLKANVTMQGFRDDKGLIWSPGYLVWVESPFLNIAQDMLIESVSYHQEGGGTNSTLQLVDPRAYGGKKGKGNKSGEAWGQDDEDAELSPPEDTP